MSFTIFKERIIKNICNLNLLVMKAAKSKINESDAGFHFDFKFCPAEDSASIKTWEEENVEYTSWNLIVEKSDPFA
jgi:hypothetical protein